MKLNLKDKIGLPFSEFSGTDGKGEAHPMMSQSRGMRFKMNAKVDADHA